MAIDPGAVAPHGVIARPELEILIVGQRRVPVVPGLFGRSRQGQHNIRALRSPYPSLGQQINGAAVVLPGRAHQPQLQQRVRIAGPQLQRDLQGALGAIVVLCSRRRVSEVEQQFKIVRRRHQHGVECHLGPFI